VDFTKGNDRQTRQIQKGETMTTEEQLRLAMIEIARLTEVIRKLKKAAKGDGFKPLFPGQSRGY
jgi:hypothetical protein